MDRVTWKCYRCIGGIDGVPKNDNFVSYFVTVKTPGKYHRLHIGYDKRNGIFTENADIKTLVDLDCGMAILEFLEADADPETEAK